MHENTETELQRDCEAIRIPSGETFTLPAGTRVLITQALGGSYTVATEMGLARITDANADALGLEPRAPQPAPASAHSTVPVDEKAVWDELRTCYDPEIPVNIVDLGLIYSLEASDEPEGKRVSVKMTLTAPGCGMGPALAADAEQRILGVPGVSSANVELVWDPPWSPAMISPAGRERLGME